MGKCRLSHCMQAPGAMCNVNKSLQAKVARNGSTNKVRGLHSWEIITTQQGRQAWGRVKGNGEGAW